MNKLKDLQLANEKLYNGKQRTTALLKLVNSQYDGLTDLEARVLVEVIDLQSTLVNTVLSILAPRNGVLETFKALESLEERGAISIGLARDGERLAVLSQLTLSPKSRAALDQFGTVPPMVTVPNKLRKNQDSPYLEFNPGPYCGKGYGDNELVLSHLNRLNSVRWKLSDDKYAFNGKDDNIRQTVGEFEACLQGNDFYVPWRYDFRGRSYAYAYQINPQGTSWQKARIEFSNQEQVTERGLYWLKIDIANNFGLDKEIYSKRIEFVDANMDKLESLLPAADDYDLARASIRALRKAQAGEATGYPLHLDATASGAQIMGILSQHKETLKLANIHTEDARYDLYSEVYAKFISLGGDSKYTRKQIKDVCIPMFYGSKKTPEDFFGKGTKALEMFNKAFDATLGGVKQILTILANTWNPSGVQKWTLPDGFQVVSRYSDVVDTVYAIPFKGRRYHCTVSVDTEMEKKHHKSNGANVVHSIDAYIFRELTRYAMRDEKALRFAKALLLKSEYSEPTDALIKAQGTVSLELAYTIDSESVKGLSEPTRAKLLVLIDKALSRPFFEVSGVHDCFTCHPNYGDHLQSIYLDVLLELAGSTLLQSICFEINGTKFKERPVNLELIDTVSKSMYPIC